MIASYPKGLIVDIIETKQHFCGIVQLVFWNMTIILCVFLVLSLPLPSLSVSPPPKATEAADVECSTEQYLYHGKCCTKCQPGFGLVSHCTDQQDTVCNACEAGKTFSSDSPHTNTCQTCSTCDPEKSHEREQCNVFQDTKCECNNDMYYNATKKRCILCDACTSGSGAFQKCTPTQNAICEACPEGYFSEVWSPSEPCRKCKVCEEPVVTMIPCSNIQDTLCLGQPVVGGGKTARYNPSQPEDKPTEDPEVVASDKARDRNKAIYIYCGIMVAVICGVLIYVIVKHRSRLSSDRQRSKYSQPKFFVITNTNYENSDTSLKLVNEKMKARELPGWRRKEIEHALNTLPPDYHGWTWDSLGRALGYNARDLTQFESRSLGEPHTPLILLFRDWATREDSTVEKLIMALKSVRRYDVLNVVNKELVKPGSECSTDVSTGEKPAESDCVFSKLLKKDEACENFGNENVV